MIAKTFHSVFSPLVSAAGLAVDAGGFGEPLNSCQEIHQSPGSSATLVTWAIMCLSGPNPYPSTSRSIAIAIRQPNAELLRSCTGSEPHIPPHFVGTSGIWHLCAVGANPVPVTREGQSSGTPAPSLQAFQGVTWCCSLGLAHILTSPQNSWAGLRSFS